MAEKVLDMYPTGKQATRLWPDYSPTRSLARTAGANLRHVTRQGIVCPFVSELFFSGPLFPELFFVDLEVAVRPFLTQSDTASRKRPFSTGLFFDWILLVLLLIVSRADFVVLVLFLEAVGVREYCYTAVESSFSGALFCGL